MAENTKIEWTDSTWTPIRARRRDNPKSVGWHCEHVSEGCTHCYAETMNMRLGTAFPFKPGHRKDVEIFLDEKMLTIPLRWKRSRKIFVCSMTDLFADFVTDATIDKMFAVMALCPQHIFQVLTKRPERMRAYVSRDPEDRLDDICHELSSALNETWHYPSRWPLPNLWLGTSVEDQATADARIPLLLDTPAAIRFISYEPALGPLRLWVNEEVPLPFPHPDWLICGGESGGGARLMDPDWAREIRDDCAHLGVAFFMKQMTKKAPIPDDLMVREFPVTP